MTEIHPKLTSREAFALCERIHKKFKNLDFERALDHHEFVVINRYELYELVASLDELKERLQWGI